MATKKTNKDSGEKKMAKSKMAAKGELTTLRMDQIFADPQWNARRPAEVKKDGTVVYRKATSAEKGEGATDLNSLKASIRAQGLLTPLTVVKSGDDGDSQPYTLVAGFRRFQALKELKKLAAPAMVYPAGTSEADIRILNLTENLQRENLHPSEIAEACVELRDDFELDGPTIAKRLGLSKSYVNNLMRAKDRVHPKIWAAFKDRAPAATSNFITLKLASVEDHDTQWEMWLEQCGMKGADETGQRAASKGDGGDGKPKRPKTRSRKEIETMRQCLREERKSSSSKASFDRAIAALGWVLGDPEAKLPVKSETWEAANEKPKKGNDD